MLIWTTRIRKKRAVLAVIALGIALAAVILLFGTGESAPEEEAAPLLTNEDRVSYLQSLGWQVEAEPVETLQFLLPSKLEEPYLSYNELQLAQGFDLAACCGKQVARYTYTVCNYPGVPTGVQLNLYVCETLPVAGDVFCAGSNGFQDTLIFPEPKG